MPSCVHSNAAWHKGSGNRCQQNEDGYETSLEKKKMLIFSAVPSRAALVSGAASDTKIFLKMLGFQAFSKTLALLCSSSLERDLVLGDAAWNWS